MTTTPVMTITDEQIAEIERDIAYQAAIKHGQCEGGVVVRDEICRECGATPKDSCRRPLPKSYAVPANITALIYRLRSAEKDVARMEWIEDNYHGDGGGNYFNMRLRFERDIDDCGSIRGLIDAAMEQSK